MRQPHKRKMKATYFIIELSLTNKDGFLYSDFDSKAYSEEKGINLIGKPISVEYKSDKLILVFEGKTQPKTPFEIHTSS